jgi:hypothetical protein
MMMKNRLTLLHKRGDSLVIEGIKGKHQVDATYRDNSLFARRR